MDPRVVVDSDHDLRALTPLYYRDGDFYCTIAPIWLSTPLRRTNLWQMVQALTLTED